MSGRRSRIVWAVILTGCRASAAHSRNPMPPRVLRESCDQLSSLTTEAWQLDHPQNGLRELPDQAKPFADDGAWFQQHRDRFAVPAAYRLSLPVGSHGFLTVESYSRTRKAPRLLIDVVGDPDHPGNRVWRLASPDHTDATVLRTTQPLGNAYQICARVGHIRFGTGEGANGYDGGERSDPWIPGDATAENGCYFGALSRVVPRPHNNALAHYTRVAFIDSDNNLEGWTRRWDPASRQFVSDGRHPIMMGLVDSSQPARAEDGWPFLAFAQGEWHGPGELTAVDAYKEDAWYTVCFERAGTQLTMRIAGDFLTGGITSYEAVHELHDDEPIYWFLGDPHINYYEGSMLIDDITLTLP